MAAVVTLCALGPGSAVGANSPVLRGFGTAVLDGVLSPGEWDSAGHADFTVDRAPDEGGGTVPGTFYVMNDAGKLYIGVKVSNATIGASQLSIQFGSRSAEGSDYIGVDRYGAFEDRFIHLDDYGIWRPVDDTDFGGSLDGAEAEADAPGYSFYELAHPLNDGDDPHDFSLATPMRTRFNVSFTHCSAQDHCAVPSHFPAIARAQADIVVVSGSRIAPETRITSGPREGSVIGNPTPSILFTASDDTLAAADLTFECKLDEDIWQECKSPNKLILSDGKHIAEVRAIDEMLNADASPAQLSFTVDTTGPTKPVVRGLRTLRKGRGTLRFSAKDHFTRAGKIRFKCAVDSARLRRCPAVYRVRFRLGRHVVRVRAVDSVGNQGDIATFHLRVKRPHR